VRHTQFVEQSTTASLVGRARELGELAALVEDALAGHGRLAVILGEAGIGKTRLCQELAKFARARGMGVAWSACWESAGLPAFWPWSQLLDQLGTAMPSAARTESTPEVARASLFASVRDALRGAVKQRPWLLIIDDLHWADAGTARLLAYLAPLVRSMRALIVVTIRDGAEAETALVGTLGRLGDTVPVGGLSCDEVRDLAVHLGIGPDRVVASGLHRVTAGNPLFATELARHLHHGDALTALAGNRHLPVPPTVRAVLGERLTGMSANCREVLEYGAVAGGEFALSVVAEAADHDIPSVLAAIAEAAAARLVRMAGPASAAFCHPLMRSVLYDDIGLARRAELHCRVAEAIEGRAAVLADTDLASLAYHYLMAASQGAAAKAAAFCAQAAARAMRNLAYEEAAELFGHALMAHELEPAGSDRGELLLGAAEAHAASGDTVAARRLFLAAVRQARSDGEGAQLARAALGLAGSGFEVALFDSDQVALLHEGLGMLGDAHVALRSRLQARLSVALSLAGDEDRRAALATGAVALAEASGDDAAVAAALAARCDVQAGPAMSGNGPLPPRRSWRSRTAGETMVPSCSAAAFGSWRCWKRGTCRRSTVRSMSSASWPPGCTSLPTSGMSGCGVRPGP
jgi:predicted ATPase